MKNLIVKCLRALINNKVINSAILDKKLFTEKQMKIYELRNAFYDKRCIIIGNGPSLNKCDLSFIQKEYSFGVNGIFYKTDESQFKPTFYTVEDSHVMKENVQRIRDYEVSYKFFPTNYAKYFKNENQKNLYFFNMNRGFYEPSSKHYEEPLISSDCSEIIYCGQSVTIINIQMALYLGFKEIYLIGMDFNYEIPDSAIVKNQDITSTEDDVNHFHPDYFGKGKSWHDPKLHNVLKSYEHLHEHGKKSGVSIYNATVGGKLEVFPRVDYNETFSSS